MPAPIGPLRLAAKDGPYLDCIAVNSALDPDFTDTANSPTGGWCARGLYVEGNGAITFYAIGAPGLDGTAPTVASRTVTVGDKTFLPVAVASIDNTNTNASGIHALL